MKTAYTVQRTRNAHPPHAVPASAWVDHSHHRKCRRAVAEHDRLHRAAFHDGGWHYCVRVIDRNGQEMAI